jgi:hypothetical protein
MYSRQFAKYLVIPAQAGIHSAVARSNSAWVPAFAGTTEGYASASLMFLPTKYSDDPEK